MNKLIDNPFITDVENLYDGEFFPRDLTSEEIPTDILNFIAPDFAIRFNLIPLAFDSYGTFYLTTTEENFLPMNLFTIKNIEEFLSERWGINCRILATTQKNIQNALEKFYNFSDELLKKSLIKFYDFDRLTFNDYEKMIQWAKQYDGKVIKNSLLNLAESVEKVLHLVPSKIAINYNLIPLGFDDEKNLILATSSSRTFDCGKEFSEMLKNPCKMLLTLDENIREALEKFYHFDGLTKKFSQRTKFDFLIDGNYIDWTFLDIDFSPELLEKVPANIAVKFHLIPLDYDSDKNLILVTSSPETINFKNEISEILQTDCKILITDAEHFSDALEVAYDLEEFFPEPFGNWANLRYKFLVSYRPEELLRLKDLGEYENYFEKFQIDSSERLNFLIQRQLEHENISDSEIVRASCREILIDEICR